VEERNNILQIHFVFVKTERKTKREEGKKKETDEEKTK
jgi:hypothetical protein